MTAPVPLAEQIAETESRIEFLKGVLHSIGGSDQKVETQLTRSRAILATLEQHERAMAVVAALRRWGAAAAPSKREEAWGEIWENLAALDAAQETDRE